MKKTISIFVLALVAMTTLFTVGCQKQVNNGNVILDSSPVETIEIDPRAKALSSDPQVQKELMFLKNNMGFDLSKVYILKGEASGNYGVVDGWEAVEFSRVDIQERMKPKESSDHAKHRVSTMSTSGAKNIRVLSGVPTVWANAVEQGRTAWNSLNKTLSFNPPTSGSFLSGRVNVSYVDLSTLGYPSNTIATGTSPSASGVIGTNLRINSMWVPAVGAVTTSLTVNQRKYIITHELGHIIGFFHTDSYAGSALVTLNYVCTNSTDPSSILRSGSDPVPSSTVFSTCDIDAFDWYYGLS